MPYTIDTTTWRSPNYTDRPGAITAIVVHSCEGRWPFPRQSSLPWLCDPVSKVSCHYYVCRNAEIFQLVDDRRQAWHAGGRQDDGTWTAQPDYANAKSLGIECEHRAGQDWPEAQRQALAWLLRQLMTLHQIPLEKIETHGQIAIKGPYIRKQDPTNWPHGEFVKWRKAQLGGALPADRFAAWGPIGKPEGLAQDFAIPRAWLVNQTLGRCVAGETWAVSGAYSIAEFERGLITYLRARDVALVELF